MMNVRRSFWTLTMNLARVHSNEFHVNKALSHSQLTLQYQIVIPQVTAVLLVRQTNKVHTLYDKHTDHLCYYCVKLWQLRLNQILEYCVTAVGCRRVVKHLIFAFHSLVSGLFHADRSVLIVEAVCIKSQPSTTQRSLHRGIVKDQCKVVCKDKTQPFLF